MKAIGEKPLSMADITSLKNFVTRNRLGCTEKGVRFTISKGVQKDGWHLAIDRLKPELQERLANFFEGKNHDLSFRKRKFSLTYRVLNLKLGP